MRRLLPHPALALAAALTLTAHLAPAQGTADFVAATVDLDFSNEDGSRSENTFTAGTATRGTAVGTDAGSRTSLGTINVNGPVTAEDFFLVVDPRGGCAVTGGTATISASVTVFGFTQDLGTETVDLVVAGRCPSNTFPTPPNDNLAPCSGAEVALTEAPGTPTVIDLSAAAAFLGPNGRVIDIDVTFTPATSAGCVPAATTLFGSALAVRGNQPVPVELASFTGARERAGDVLHWTAASEVAVAGYAVERSGDGEEFAAVGFVDALGTGGGPRDYTFAASPRLGAGPAYYRLRAVDHDGAYEYSAVVAVGGRAAAPRGPRLVSNYASAGEGWVVEDNVNEPAAGSPDVATSDVATSDYVEAYSTGGRLLKRYRAAPGAPIGSDLPAGAYLLRLGAGAGPTVRALLH